MSVWRLSKISAAALALAVSGCGEQSNPMIGTWTLANAGDSSLPACLGLNGLAFTDKTVTTGGPAKSTDTVSYGRDGNDYLATASAGQTYRADIESGGIDVNGCHLVRAALFGTWKTVPGQSEQCSEVASVEFTEDTMTWVYTKQQPPTAVVPVTYSRDGDLYVVNWSNGPTTIKIESGGIEMVRPGGCHFVPDS